MLAELLFSIASLGSTIGAQNAPERLTLSEAIEIAQKRSVDVVIAKEDLLLVDVQWLQAYAPIMPRLDLSMTAGELFSGRQISESRTRPVGAIVQDLGDNPDNVLPLVPAGPFFDFQSENFSHPAFTFGLTARQLLLDGGRWWTVIARTHDVETSQKEALSTVRQTVAQQVTEAFYQLLKSDRTLRLLTQQRGLAQAQLRWAEAMMDAGRSTRGDIATAIRNLSDDSIELRRSRLTKRRAERALNLLLGRSPGIEVEPIPPLHVLTSTLSEQPRWDAEDWKDRALAQRPELKQARAELKAQRKLVDIQKADYWPELALEASYRKRSRRPDRVFNSPAENYTAQLDLTVRWNLFEGRATEARVQTQTIELRKAAQRLKALERQTQNEVLDALESLQTLWDVLKLAQRGAGAAQEAAQLARARYREGRGTSLELRDAELGYTRAQLQVVTARLDLEIAKSQLARAAGEAWPQKSAGE